MSWRDRAVCKGKPTWMFFDGDSETFAEKTKREKAVKAMCAVCPVTEPCLEDGKTLDGIWGGLTAAERRGRRRQTVILERPFVQSAPQDNEPVPSHATQWTVIETNGTHCIWQRDSTTTWHGYEWGVVRSGILTSTHHDLYEAYAEYGRMLR